MPANTPNRSYTYATSDDANDLAFISQRLAEQIDADVQAVVNTSLAAVPAGRLYRTSALSMANGWSECTAWTAETYRRGGMGYVSPRYVVPRTGLYTLNAQLSWVSGGTGRRGGAFTLNGALLTTSSDHQTVIPHATSGTVVNLSGVLYLTANDAIGLAGYQDTGAAINSTNAILGVSWLGY